jgi:hypothetical protein
MASVPSTPTTETIEQRVLRLLGRWRAETAYQSSSSAIAGHPAYQELIALGPAALPFLFRDLEQTKDGHLSKALTAITGAHRAGRRPRQNCQDRRSLAALGQGERPSMVVGIEAQFPASRRTPPANSPTTLDQQTRPQRRYRARSARKVYGTVAVILKPPTA